MRDADDWSVWIEDVTTDQHDRDDCLRRGVRTLTTVPVSCLTFIQYVDHHRSLSAYMDAERSQLYRALFSSSICLTAS
jgi:hypothetical protein